MRHPLLSFSQISFWAYLTSRWKVTYFVPFEWIVNLNVPKTSIKDRSRWSEKGCQDLSKLHVNHVQSKKKRNCYGNYFNEKKHSVSGLHIILSRKLTDVSERWEWVLWWEALYFCRSLLMRSSKCLLRPFWVPFNLFVVWMANVILILQMTGNLKRPEVKYVLNIHLLDF